MYVCMYLICMWVFCLPVYLCTICMHGTLGEQKITLGTLELELQDVLSHHMGAED